MANQRTEQGGSNVIGYDSAVRMGDDLEQEFERTELRQNIVKRYSLALVRCLPLDEVIDRARDLHNDNQQDAILYHLLEESFTDEQVLRLSSAITHLCISGDSVPAKQKPPIDRAISRLLRSLTEEDAWKIAEVQLLGHRRKARRLIAYTLMKRVKIDSTHAKLVWDNYLRYGDIEALQIVARSPVLPVDLDASEVLARLDGEYWRARFLASLLSSKRAAAYELAATYPLEFVWAVGRVADEGALPILRSLLSERMNDLKFMGFYIWALGSIGTRDDLESLREWVETQAAAVMATYNSIND